MNIGPHAVTSDEVQSYEALVERMARRYDGVRGAEFDDLAQEGRIAVWEALSLDKPHTSVPDAIQNRLWLWIRHVSREGMGGYDESLPNS